MKFLVGERLLEFGHFINLVKEENLPLPVFQNISDGFMVTVFTENTGGQTGGQTSGQTSGQTGGQTGGVKSLDAILEIIRANPKATRKEMATLLNINSSAVQKHLDNLKKQGVIKREGGDFGGFWVIIG